MVKKKSALSQLMVDCVLKAIFRLSIMDRTLKAKSFYNAATAVKVCCHTNRQWNISLLVHQIQNGGTPFSKDYDTFINLCGRHFSLPLSKAFNKMHL
ncbi:hypothetical protein CEXT_231961 [Caerostris extrusa]|uniref:Uncharacterized protein n=1 Tax=Caerostris extrusa TaxID=172846 RepID=A0AAV4SN09_CAEEX|nr:hypothetical protein CEXT_231961 [Caerostris extrusa]